MKFSYVIVLVILQIIIFSTSSFSQNNNVEQLMVMNPWARATMTSSQNGVVYLSIMNKSDSTVYLNGASSKISEMVMLHQTTIDERNIAKMTSIDKVAINPKEKINLEPGGLHLMLKGISGPLMEGDNFSLILYFEKGGSIEIIVNVKGYSHVREHKHASSE